MITTILTIIILILVATLVYLVSKKPVDNKENEELLRKIDSLNEQATRQSQQTLNLLMSQISQQRESQERGTNLLHTKLDASVNEVNKMQSKMVAIEENYKWVADAAKSLKDLQNILQAPKLRGGLGEMWLEDLIGQILPSEHYKMQYTFKSGDTCDAVIFLRDGAILPIDSKFSLENFSKLIDAKDNEKEAFKKAFGSDIKKRIDEIAKKYILPHENTLEFAFMYVPAENVYYQAFIQDSDLLTYAFSKKVIPVSPSSFYAYLQVIIFGLRGMQIEESAREIQQNLAGLSGELNKFRDNFEKVGTHMRHAQSSFENSDKQLTRIEGRFTQISSSDDIPLIAEND